MVAYFSISLRQDVERTDIMLKSDRHNPEHGLHSDPFWKESCLTPLDGQ